MRAREREMAVFHYFHKEAMFNFLLPSQTPVKKIILEGSSQEELPGSSGCQDVFQASEL